MRLWAIGWLALWGVVFGLNDNLIIFAQANLKILEKGGKDATVQQQDQTTYDADKENKETTGKNKKVATVNLADAAKKQKIAKKNLKFIGTPFTKGSKEDIEAKTKAFNEAIKDQKDFLKKNYYRKRDNPSHENVASIEAEINEIKNGQKLNSFGVSYNKKEYEICSEISGNESISFYSFLGICSPETVEEFTKSKITALDLLKLAYTKKDKLEQQITETKSEAQAAEDKLKQGIDDAVILDREKYQEALISKKNRDPFMNLSILYSLSEEKKISSQEMKNRFNSKEKINTEIQKLATINCKNGKIVCIEKSTALPKIIHLENAKRLTRDLKIIEQYQTTFKKADEDLKKLMDRQSSQDFIERLNEISERESKDYGFDTGTILRPYEMKNTTNFSLQRLLQKLLKVLVRVIGTFAVLGVMIGALLWLTAQGDENRITQGKEVVIWSCVGVALAYLSNILVNWWMDAVIVVIGG